MRCGGVYELVLCGCHACDQSEHKSRDFCKIGYPHACQAYVCIGNLKKIEREERNEYVRYMKTKVQYEVKSCTGNSGGMVIPFKPRGEFGYKRLYVHPHYGRFEMSNTIGVSGGWCKGDK